MDPIDNNYSFAPVVQQFSPERLSFVDEKEAKDNLVLLRHNSISNLSNNSETSLQSSPNSRPRPRTSIDYSIPSLNTNRISGFERSRFTSKIDDHFVCKLCTNVVKNPIECENCENLICKDCSISINSCPYDCQQFSIKKVARFALKIYSKFHLKCKNFTLGCNFSGLISEVVSHEEECLYVFVRCQNPLCEKELLKADKFEGLDSLLVCSDICWHIVKLNDENYDDPLELLRSFSTRLEEAKLVIEAEVKIEMKSSIDAINKKKAQIYKASNEKEKLNEKIHKRQSYYHSGRWNVNSRLWSCCGNINKYIIGCKEVKD